MFPMVSVKSFVVQLNFDVTAIQGSRPNGFFSSHHQLNTFLNFLSSYLIRYCIRYSSTRLVKKITWKDSFHEFMI